MQKDVYHVGKLCDYASVFTAELKAILEALKLINESKYKNFVIYTDSSSAITALKESYSFHPLIQQAQEWLFRLASKFKDVIFCWVPAHVGIEGNEAADSEAKNAATLERAQMFGIPHSDMKGPIKS